MHVDGETPQKKFLKIVDDIAKDLVEGARELEINAIYLCLNLGLTFARGKREENWLNANSETQ